MHGHAFFCRDFEANVVEMNLECFAAVPGVKIQLLPLRVAFAIAFVVDLLERLLIFLYALVGAVRVTADDVLDIKAVRMAWIDIIVSDKRAREVLGYTPIVSKAECMRETAEWCGTFWEGLGATGGGKRK